ncbi:hypothetical protein Ndes2437A_g07285 [Nannochloris sp. 'desiccata']
MNLEVEFFSSQPYTPPDRPINLLVVDFDDTCTSEDTTSMIARAAITAASKKGADPATAFAQGEEKLHWLVQNYLARRGNLLDEILPEPPLEDELEEFDMAWLGDFLDRISEFDREMNSVVIESKILSGVKKGALTELLFRSTGAGRWWQLRYHNRGFPWCLQAALGAQELGLKVHLLHLEL